MKTKLKKYKKKNNKKDNNNENIDKLLEECKNIKNKLENDITYNNNQIKYIKKTRKEINKNKKIQINEEIENITKLKECKCSYSKYECYKCKNESVCDICNKCNICNKFVGYYKNMNEEDIKYYKKRIRIEHLNSILKRDKLMNYFF